MNTVVTKEPELAKPGAGLPFLEWAVAKYILIPRVLKKENKQSALAMFKRETDSILKIATSLNAEQLSQRKLIKRLQGLEDSSRYWSVIMTMRHLVMAGSSIQRVVAELCKGESNLPPAHIKDLKPSPDLDTEVVLREFKRMCERFETMAESLDLDAFPRATFDHPWFGPLNARSWFIFVGLHQRVHRRQIEAIVAQFKS